MRFLVTLFVLFVVAFGGVHTAQAQNNSVWGELERVHDIRKIQEALFHLGYDIVVDGSYGPSTEKVVADFQRRLGNFGTGYLSQQERSELLHEPTEDPWMSISYDRDGHFWPEWDISGRVMANAITQRLCKKWSKYPATCQTIDRNSGWIVAVSCRDRRGGGHWSIKATDDPQEEVITAALAEVLPRVVAGYQGLSDVEDACRLELVLSNEGITWLDKR